MKVSEAIQWARQLKQINATQYPDALLLQFLNECEGKVQTEFLRIADTDVQQYSLEDMDKKLIVGPPHDKLYYTYLCAMIDFANGEYSKYNNAIIIANSFLAEWAAWFNRTHRRNGREYLGVFLSAYAIALKWGYEGTEEEWLASLRGPQGLPGEPGPRGPQGEPGNVDFEELTPEQMAMLKGEPGPAGRDGQDGRDGSPGKDGVSPTVAVTTISGGHRVAITDANKTERFDVMDGKNGQDGGPGKDGKDGQNGVSPTVTVTTITGGHRVTITDVNGTRYFDVKDGKDGAGGSGGGGADGEDGFSPIVTVTQISGGHRVTIEDLNGPQSFDVLDGSAGKDGQDGSPGKDGKDGQNGVDGYTPVRGTDYWTQADQEAIVAAVLSNFTDVSKEGQ